MQGDGVLGSVPLAPPKWLTAASGGGGSGPRGSVAVVAGRCGRAGFLGQRGEREVAAGSLLEDTRRLFLVARVQLDEQVHDDAVLALVLVEAHVGEELAGAV